jgi:hypothetical protein
MSLNVNIYLEIYLHNNVRGDYCTTIRKDYF